MTEDQQNEVSALKARARKLGYRLVHRDEIRTATVSSRMRKEHLNDAAEHCDLLSHIQRTLARQLAEFLVDGGMGSVKELSLEYEYEFRMDINVLVPRPPDDDVLYYRPQVENVP